MVEGILNRTCFAWKTFKPFGKKPFAAPGFIKKLGLSKTWLKIATDIKEKNTHDKRHYSFGIVPKLNFLKNYRDRNHEKWSPLFSLNKTLHTVGSIIYYNVLFALKC